jgi:RNA polymerase sigma-70 factor (ECF subfamily)
MNPQQYNQFLSTQPKLYRFALSLTKDVNDAADIYQETLLKIWELRDEWQRWQSFEAYAMRMIRNEFRNQAAKNNRYLHVELDDIAERPASDITDDNMTIADLKTQFYNLIGKLPEVQRNILHLREIEEMEYKEIGEVLDLTETQVKVYLHRGRQYIKSKINGKR